MRYSLRQLEYFIAAGETGSITLASERIHISQPSISAAISHLEKELSVQLFVRHHAQGLSLTPVGKELLREAKSLVAQAELLYAKASDAASTVRGTLSVGCMVTLAPMIIPELSRSFTEAFPDVQVRHLEGDQEALIERLKRAQIDIAITYDLQLPDDVQFQELVDLPPHLIVGEAHPFANRSKVSLQELISEPLVLLDLPLSREYFLGLFTAEGLLPKIGTRTPYQEVVRTLVANGSGYALFNVRPRSTVALDGRPLIRVELAGKHRPMRIGLATLTSLKKTKLVSAFEIHCRSRISPDYIPGMSAPRLK
ncbi:MAG: LysR family transcriptional regulator [Methylobacteriaceae bacterium]|nr:LysR family transcriptional regulator [Methylobacteriaceae bacterium]